MGKLDQKHQILAVFFISSTETEWRKKTDFGQLIITLPNETENPS